MTGTERNVEAKHKYGSRGSMEETAINVYVVDQLISLKYYLRRKKKIDRK